MDNGSTPLSWSLGDWSGIRTSGEGGSTFPITISVRKILGGEGVIEEMEVQHESGPYRAFSTTVFSGNEGHWVMYYMNNVSGTFTPMQGEISDDSTWRSIEPGRSREAKLAFERTGQNEWRRTQFASTDGGETWFVIFRDDLKRVVEAFASHSMCV